MKGENLPYLHHELPNIALWAKKFKTFLRDVSGESENSFLGA
jgi:hypothetical protein